MIRLEEASTGAAARLADLLRGNLGFAALTLGLFVLAFASMSWGSRGLPRASTSATIPALRLGPLNSDPVVAQVEPTLRPSERKGWSIGAPQDDKAAGRNLMRLTAIQAANAYAQSPCDRAAKAAFIVATSTFIKSYATADDSRVRDAMQAAFAKGGVSMEEFPSDTHSWMAGIAASQDDVCAGGRRADNLR
jgi:hypothetical protein